MEDNVPELIPSSIPVQASNIGPLWMHSYQERLEHYNNVRSRIFNNSENKPSKHTLRLKNYYAEINTNRKMQISSIFNCSKDLRSYAEVFFLEFPEQGLLDTGANISCLGAELALQDFSHSPHYKPIRSSAKTAGGKTQLIIAVLNVEMCYKGVKRFIKLYIIPSIKQRLILGLDFWKTFELTPRIISSLDSSIVQEESTVANAYPLSPCQIQQLAVIKDLFPKVSETLGRTTLIEHYIDVGNEKPCKQRLYPVSPAVEKLLYQEIDRMLSLGVIESSSSPWISPMRMVVKPNKVLLCLDALKLNDATKKDAQSEHHFQVRS